MTGSSPHKENRKTTREGLSWPRVLGAILGYGSAVFIIGLLVSLLKS